MDGNVLSNGGDSERPGRRRDTAAHSLAPCPSPWPDGLRVLVDMARVEEEQLAQDRFRKRPTQILSSRLFLSTSY